MGGLNGEGRERRFGGLSENGLYRLMCLNIWSPVSGTVWERLGGVVLLEKVCQSLGRALCPKTHIRLGLSVSLCRQLSDEM